MTVSFRDLRYIRVPVADLDMAGSYASDILGLKLEDRSDTALYFRSDARNYALCYSTADEAGVALTVALRADLDAIAERLTAAGYAPDRLTEDACRARQIKAGIVAMAPNGVAVEIVWRPMTSGWPFHGTRLTGITGFQAVQLACTDIESNEAFWTDGIGAEVSDWAGQAVFLRIDDSHHRIALYPSPRDGLLGATWGVAETNDVMRNWYFLQARQQPIAHGPGRQPTSGAAFVTAKGPGDMLYSYATPMEAAPANGPRQFPDEALSHCAWGSPTDQPEFKGGQDR